MTNESRRTQPTSPAPTRRQLLAQAAALAGAGSIGLLSALPARAADKPAAAVSLASPFRDVAWEELMPKDWDPMKGLRDKGKGVSSDTDPRALALMKELREVLDNAPVNAQLNGAAVRIAGYLVPLDEVKGDISEFLLVPYFGACIHTPPPPSNQIVHVLPAQPVKGIKGMTPVWISGKLETVREDSGMGVSGYRMAAQKVTAYEPVFK
ncbi:MAG: DUF3299 domain-containing protein [Leptothrix sp. (in: b-proteobacteria)]